MGRTRHTRKRHTRRKHKRKRTRHRRRTRRRTRGGGLTSQVFGGGYKEGLLLLGGGAKSTYGVSDYPPGFSKFLRRDKRIVDKMKRKSKKHKRRHRKH